MTVFTRKERLVFQFLIISTAIGLGVSTIRKTFLKPDFSKEIENEIAEFKSMSADIDLSTLNNTTENSSKTDDIKPQIAVKLLDINTASKSDLLTLPKIGPVTAERIVRYRDDFGSFKSIDDLLLIKEIGPKTLDQLKPFIQIK
ncbi:MAG TPA: hypothetical protein DD389_00295 [Candidatus Marinimicrobia bacterium]|nr:hypothetical protein [Candidatus Neomarinimicrobiota bacterium]